MTDRARGADDTRHALLRRVRRDTQTGLDAFAAHRPAVRPRRDFFRFQVQEVDVRAALTLCRIPGEPWSLNPYVGCSHDCVYCYVPDVAHVERGRWGSYVVVKRNLPTVLARELRTHEVRDVFLSSATDPYQPAEKTYQITKRCLEVLVRAGWPVRVLTRNPLVARDIGLLGRIKNLSVGMSVPTLDDAARKVLEPGAPSVASRLTTLRRLADAGLRPYVNIAPAYPFSGGIGPREVAARLKEAGVAEVRFGPWNYLDGVLPALRTRTSETIYQAFDAAVGDTTYYDRMFRALSAACRREGVSIRAMGRGARDGAGRRDEGRVSRAVQRSLGSGFVGPVAA